jgi:hypothetical protein
MKTIRAEGERRPRDSRMRRMASGEFPREQVVATLTALTQSTTAMFRNLIRRHAAAGLYVLSVAAALLSAAGLLVYAQDADGALMQVPLSIK